MTYPTWDILGHPGSLWEPGTSPPHHQSPWTLILTSPAVSSCSTCLMPCRFQQRNNALRAFFTQSAQKKELLSQSCHRGCPPKCSGYVGSHWFPIQTALMVQVVQDTQNIVFKCCSKMRHIHVYPKSTAYIIHMSHEKWPITIQLCLTIGYLKIHWLNIIYKNRHLNLGRPSLIFRHTHRCV